MSREDVKEAHGKLAGAFNALKIGEKLVEILGEYEVEPPDPLTDEMVLATSRLDLNRWAKIRVTVEKPSPRSEDVEIRVDIGGRRNAVPLWGMCTNCDHLDGYGIADGDGS